MPTYVVASKANMPYLAEVSSNLIVINVLPFYSAKFWGNTFQITHQMSASST